MNFSKEKMNNSLGKMIFPKEKMIFS